MQINRRQKIINIFREELRGIRTAFSSYQKLPPGLYTYPIHRLDGSLKRLHLRIEPDGNGILFVDVTDVIHLNRLAVEIVKMALDDVNVRDATAIIASKYRTGNLKFREDIIKIYSVISKLVEDSDGCYTCAIGGLLDRAPMFSLQTNAPYKIDIALTYGCNNQCPHCYNEANRLAMPSLPLSHWYRVFDRIVELGIPHVILTGGEATLHPDFVEIVRYADQLGLVVGLNSNGRYLGYAPFMEKVAEAGLNHVQVTLGSCYPEVHNTMMGADSFEQTVRGIRTAISTGIHVITNTTLMRSNIGHVTELVNYLYNLGIRTFAMNGMIYSGGGFDHPNALHTLEMRAMIAKVRDLAELKQMRFLWYTPTEYCRLSPLELEVGAKKCNAGEYSICIEPNGDVLPCQSYYVSVGNILTDDWADIWHSDLFTSFRDREEHPDEYQLPEKCIDCPDMLVCGAGCRIEREAEAGIRIADMAGGGCIGCSGFSGSIAGNDGEEAKKQPSSYLHIEGGFQPYASQVATTKRSTGKMGLISINEVGIKRDGGG